MTLVQATISTYTTDQLNFWSSETDTHNITVTLSTTEDLNFTKYSDWTWVDCSQCTIAGDIANCSGSDKYSCRVNNSDTATTQTGNLSVVELRTAITDNANITFVAIDPSDIFNTEIELGEGGRNYPVNMKYGNSFDLPATNTELIIIHKVEPTPMNYLPNQSGEGDEGMLTCYYDNNATRYTFLETLPQTTAITTDSDRYMFEYPINYVYRAHQRILKTTIELDDIRVDDTLDINCTSVYYDLDDNYGEIRTNLSFFTINFRNTSAFIIDIATDDSTVYQGSQEKKFYISINNTGGYIIDKPRFQIEAPKNPKVAKWIDVEGEISGVESDMLIYEPNQMDIGENWTIIATARFNFTGFDTQTPDITVNARYYPIWERNAKGNPNPTIQELTVNDVVTIDTGSTVTITDIRTRLDEIYQLAEGINTTIESVNTMIELINATVQAINITINEINATLTDIFGIVVDTNRTLYEINDSLFSQSNFGAYTLADLNASINTGSAGLTTKIDRLKEQLQELPYLVTDSLSGAIEHYEQADTAIMNGDLGEALHQLEQSKQLFIEAQNEINNGSKITITQRIKSYLKYWHYLVIGFLGITIVGVFLKKRKVMYSN